MFGGDISCIPDSMKEELGKWNNGQGIDLESWVGATGNFGLAVGYASIFWPDFVEFEGYVLRKGFNLESLRGFEEQSESNFKATEWVMNHIHLDGIQYLGCEDISIDKLTLLGNVLKEIHQAKLKWLFPTKECKVELYIPENKEDFTNYQLSFWQAKYE